MENNLQSVFENTKGLYDKGNYLACKQQFQELLNKNYEPIVCHYYLGVININLQDYNEAESHLLSCLKSEPNNYNYLYYLGLIAEHQQNNDLATHYYSKTLKIKPNHINAINALKRLNPTPITTVYPLPPKETLVPTVPPPTPTVTPIPTGVKNELVLPEGDLEETPLNNFTDLYEQLLSSTDKDSQTAIRNIELTKIIKKKPNLNAVKGWTYRLCVFFLIFLLPIIVSISFFFPFFHFLDPAPLAIIIAPFLWFRIYTIRRSAKNTYFTVDRGLIQIKTGAFKRSYAVYWIHKADRFSMYQSYWQLRTGECTLFFVYEGSGTIYMKGIGKPQEIQQLAQQLESLRNQLRSTLAIKSGIYG